VAIVADLAVRADRVAWAYRVPATGGPGWQESAVCAHADPEQWWPESGDAHGAAAAVALCLGCPVVGDCREAFHRQAADAGGVWFATTPNDREQARLVDAA